MPEEQLVLFSLGREKYAVSITQVKEIIQYKGTTKLPNTPPYIEGITNLRGKIIPVIDLSKRLGLGTSKCDDRRALIIEIAGRETGILVDEVSEVIRLQDSAIDPLPAVTSNGYIRGVGKDGNRLIILLDVNRLFSEDEVQDLKMVG